MLLTLLLYLAPTSIAFIGCLLWAIDSIVHEKRTRVIAGIMTALTFFLLTFVQGLLQP